MAARGAGGVSKTNNRFLEPYIRWSYDHILAGFRNGLKETGYVDRQNVELEYRWADDDYDRLPELAASRFLSL